MELSESVSEASILGQTLAGCCIVGSVITALGPLPTILKIKREKTIGEFPATPYFTWCLSTSAWLSYHLLNENIPLVVALTASSFLAVFYVVIYVRYSNKEKRKTILFLTLLTLISLAAIVYAYLMEMRVEIVITATVIFFVFLISPMTVIVRVVQTKSCASLPFELPCAAAFNGLSYALYGYLVAGDLSLWGTGLIAFLISSLQLSCHLLFGNFTENLTNMCCYPCSLCRNTNIEANEEEIKIGFGKPAMTTVITV